MKSSEKLFKRAQQAQAAGDLPQAIRLFKDVLKVAPRHLDATYLLGTAQAMSGALQEAVVTLQKAAEIGPGSAMVRTNLGLALKMLGRGEEAEAAFREALALDPKLPQAANNLAALLVARGRPSEAEALAAGVLKTSPEAAGYALIQLANAQADQARVAEALASLERLLEPPPGSAVAWSNFLSLLHYDPARGPREIFDLHRRWGQRFGASPPARRMPSGRKRIRVGYLSPDFRAHPVGLLIEPVVARHDPARVEVFLYHDSSVQDAVTSRLRAIDGVTWRDVGGVSDAALASRIRSDEIQVLMDLSGHLSGNRLAVFGARAAPVQGTWLGYPGTTGLPAMDFAVSDPVFDPPEEENRWYSERLVRLNRPAFCFAPPDDAPPVAPPAGGGTFRFGSFNNLRKMNDDVIAVWSRILARVPDSVLVMQTRALGDEGVRRRLVARFRDHGIGEERVEFRATSALAEHLRLLSETHLCLDPWPWNGHMTTLNALWMGVPVLTLAGDRRAWRMGRCILSALGLDALVTDSRDAFVESAVKMTRDAGLLKDLRAGLRQRMAESPLTDGRGLAAELERVYSTMLDETA